MAIQIVLSSGSGVYIGDGPEVRAEGKAQWLTKDPTGNSSVAVKKVKAKLDDLSELAMHYSPDAELPTLGSWRLWSSWKAGFRQYVGLPLPSALFPERFASSAPAWLEGLNEKYQKNVRSLCASDRLAETPTEFQKSLHLSNYLFWRITAILGFAGAGIKMFMQIATGLFPFAFLNNLLVTCAATANFDINSLSLYRLWVGWNVGIKLWLGGVTLGAAALLPYIGINLKTEKTGAAIEQAAFNLPQNSFSAVSLLLMGDLKVRDRLFQSLIESSSSVGAWLKIKLSSTCCFDSEHEHPAWADADKQQTIGEYKHALREAKRVLAQVFENLAFRLSQLNQEELDVDPEISKIQKICDNYIKALRGNVDEDGILNDKRVLQNLLAYAVEHNKVALKKEVLTWGGWFKSFGDAQAWRNSAYSWGGAIKEKAQATKEIFCGEKSFAQSSFIVSDQLVSKPEAWSSWLAWKSPLLLWSLLSRMGFIAEAFKSGAQFAGAAATASVWDFTALQWLAAVPCGLLNAAVVIGYALIGFAVVYSFAKRFFALPQKIETPLLSFELFGKKFELSLSHLYLLSCLVFGGAALGSGTAAYKASLEVGLGSIVSWFSFVASGCLANLQICLMGTSELGEVLVSEFGSVPARTATVAKRRIEGVGKKIEHSSLEELDELIHDQSEETQELMVKLFEQGGVSSQDIVRIFQKPIETKLDEGCVSGAALVTAAVNGRAAVSGRPPSRGYGSVSPLTNSWSSAMYSQPSSSLSPVGERAALLGDISERTNGAGSSDSANTIRY